MKKLIYLPLILLSCASNSVKESAIVVPKDSIAQFINSYTNKVKTIRFLFKELAKRDSSLKKEDAVVDFLLVDVKKYQGNEIDKIKLLKQLDYLSNFSSHYSDSIALLKKENVKVVTELRKVNGLYATSKNEINKAKKENEDLKKQFGIPKPTQVIVKCYGFKVRRFRSSVEFETLLAKEVKRVTIQFNIPFNNLIEKDSYTFTTKFVGVFSKTKTIKMTGKEIIGMPDSFDVIGLNAGDYPIEILVDNQKEYESKITLQ